MCLCIVLHNIKAFSVKLNENKGKSGQRAKGGQISSLVPSESGIEIPNRLAYWGYIDLSMYKRKTRNDTIYSPRVLSLDKMKRQDFFFSLKKVVES